RHRGRGRPAHRRGARRLVAARRRAARGDRRAPRRAPGLRRDVGGAHSGLEHPAGDGPRVHRRPVLADLHGAEHLRRGARPGRAGVPVMRVEGKAAVVVGAGQTPGETVGNGRATSLLLAREGATVLAVDRDLERAEATVAEIRSEGGAATAMQADVTVEDDCRAIAATALERLGRVDVLVNNVGIGTGDAGASTLTEEAWDLIHSVNLKGMWMTCKHVLPHMRARGSGSVVN